MTITAQRRQTVDLPHGQFLVLDHVALVGISEPYYIVMGGHCESFVVWAITNQGSRIACKAFPAAPLYGTDTHWGPVDPNTRRYKCAQAAAEEYAAELRSLIEGA